MIGPVITVGRVRSAAEATLKLWLPSSLAYAARADGRNPSDRRKVPPVRTWHRIPNIERAKDDQLPSLSVASGGLVDDADDDGEGRFSATWGLVVSIFVRGQSYEDAADLAGMFCAAVRVAIAQHGDLGGLATSTVWLGEQYDLGDPDSARSIAGGFVSFAAHIPNVLDIYAAPDDPPADPLEVLDDPPLAESFSVETALLDD